MPSTRPIPTPLSQRLAHLRTGPLAALVWLIGAALCVSLMDRRGGGLELVGLVCVDEVSVTAPMDAEVAEVLVELYDEVAQGDALALLDGAALEARLATAAAEVERLSAELGAAAARLADEAELTASDRVAELRRFRNDEDELRLDALGVAVELERDRLDRDRLQARLDRIGGLADQGLHPALERDDLALRIRGLDGAITRNEALLEGVERAAEDAAARRAAFTASLPGSLPLDEHLRPLREAVQVQSLRVAEVAVLRSQLVLRAPIAGRVRALGAGAGQTVRLGDAVAVVADPVATRVVAYLPAARAHGVAPGARLVLARAADPRAHAETVVFQVGPAVEQLPPLLWADPAMPEYGVPVTAFATPSLALVPGEPIRARVAGKGPAPSRADSVARAD